MQMTPLEYHRAVQTSLEEHEKFSEFIEVLTRRDSGFVVLVLQELCDFGYKTGMTVNEVANTIISAALAADESIKRKEN